MNGPRQAQQMCRRGQCHGDGVQAGNTRGGTGERRAYMVHPLFFIFYSFCWLFYILPAHSHQPNMRNATINCVSCVDTPSFLPEHPKYTLWVYFGCLVCHTHQRATEDKKHAHMGMFLIFSGILVPIFSISTNQTHDLWLCFSCQCPLPSYLNIQNTSMCLDVQHVTTHLLPTKDKKHAHMGSMFLIQ